MIEKNKYKVKQKIIETEIVSRYNEIKYLSTGLTQDIQKLEDDCENKSILNNISCITGTIGKFKKAITELSENTEYVYQTKDITATILLSNNQMVMCPTLYSKPIVYKKDAFFPDADVRISEKVVSEHYDNIQFSDNAKEIIKNKTIGSGSGPGSEQGSEQGSGPGSEQGSESQSESEPDPLSLVKLMWR